MCLKPGMFRMPPPQHKQNTTVASCSRNTNPPMLNLQGCNSHYCVRRPQLKCYHVKIWSANNSHVKTPELRMRMLTREFKYHSNGTVKFIVVPKLFSSHSRQLITTKNWITIPPSHSNLRTIGQTVVTATSIPFKCSIFEDILSRKLRFKDKDFRYSDFEASRYAKVNEAMLVKDTRSQGWQ
ncbi:hypothetical protein Tco_0823322 [Tanacetum coccineum]|uniref:Uncharacterized protein n=1 Tax=Tanacetum coccineum TaxID=301880 RepID=A0ABQ5AIJ7_9ASTR